MLVLIALVLLIVFLCAAISMMSSSSKANKLAQEKLRREAEQQKEEKQAQQSAADREFEENWAVMTRYDNDVRSQVDRLEPHGDQAVNELKRAFRVTGDKTRLADITDRILEDIETGKLKFDSDDSPSSS